MFLFHDPMILMIKILQKLETTWKSWIFLYIFKEIYYMVKSRHFFMNNGFGCTSYSSSNLNYTASNYITVWQSMVTLGRAFSIPGWQYPCARSKVHKSSWEECGRTCLVKLEPPIEHLWDELESIMSQST